MNLFAKKYLSPSVLVLGAGPRAANLYREAVEQSAEKHSNILGFLPIDERDDSIPASLLLDNSATLLEWSQKLHVKEVVVIQDHPDQRFPTQQLLDCKLEGIKLSQSDSIKPRLRQVGASWRDSVDSLLMAFTRIHWR